MEVLTLSPIKTLFLKSHILNSTFRPNFINPYTTKTHNLRPLSFTLFTCKLKTPQDIKNNDKNVSKKIVLSEAAPPLGEEGGGGGGNGNGEVRAKSRGRVMGLVKRFPRKVLGVLSNLPLAIGEMFTVAALMALGMLCSSLLFLNSNSYCLLYFFLFFWNWIRLGCVCVCKGLKGVVRS